MIHYAVVLSAVRSFHALRMTSQETGNMPWGGFDYILEPAMPKVGSRTMIFSLGGTPIHKKQERYPPIIKAHDTGIALDFLKKMPSNKNVLVVTMARNPFSQQISLFFEGLTNKHMTNHLKWDKAKDMNMKQLSDAFERAISPDSYNHWFSDDLQKITGVNVLNHRFDFNKKHMLVHSHTAKNTNMSVLVLRVEDAPEWENIMQSFLPGWKMQTKNQADDEQCADKYEEFKRSYHFPPRAVKIISSSDHMHFYTKTEKSAIVSQNFNVQSAEEQSSLYMGDLDPLGSEDFSEVE